jgi:steroid delta-isomerase-like uncharacterized protein
MADAIDIVRKSIEAWNAHDANGVAALVSSDYMFESDTVPAPLRGPDGVRQLVEMYVRAFPDIRVEIVETLISGDHVTTRWRATGIHGGDLMGIPATHRHVVTNGCNISEVRNGKVVRESSYWDTGNLLRQLGVLPAPSVASR